MDASKPGASVHGQCGGEPPHAANLVTESLRYPVVHGFLCVDTEGGVHRVGLGAGACLADEGG
ncbi:Uncharacterised protein [Mycobacteroides abscessus subsp. abscessus]|nr:Uncharacterised protein [Mycobacteroides abscessus subsp. abscessus]